ncbi:SREBP regulating gene protein-like [Macaca thibetana thibetana]|uniref:SREBP regulating gene protein-like n=1 Tax=Macaca thibetana thibetana TaxID=257877 RepID=UPI0021BCDEB6|nr:SREBP regulating gene protein-like [Macaca thibetana thibetana]
MSAEEVGARPGLWAVTHLLPQEHLQAGYVCERKDLLVNGCCNVNVPGTKQYCCDGCWPNCCCDCNVPSTKQYCCHGCWSSGCCNINLLPNKQLLLECFPSWAAGAFQNLFMAVEEHFELCLATCRTSTRSRQHENTYQYPIAKSC